MRTILVVTIVGFCAQNPANSAQVTEHTGSCIGALVSGPAVKRLEIPPIYFTIPDNIWVVKEDSGHLCIVTLKTTNRQMIYRNCRGAEGCEIRGTLDEALGYPWGPADYWKTAWVKKIDMATRVEEWGEGQGDGIIKDTITDPVSRGGMNVLPRFDDGPGGDRAPNILPGFEDNSLGIVRAGKAPQLDAAGAIKAGGGRTTIADDPDQYCVGVLRAEGNGGFRVAGCSMGGDQAVGNRVLSVCRPGLRCQIVATGRLAGVGFYIDQIISVTALNFCGGTLSRSGSDLRVQNGFDKTETCWIQSAEDKRRVLNICSLGQVCRVSGETAPCRHPGECVEITRANSVTRTHYAE